MNGVDRLEMRKSLKERLGLTGRGCCGATWAFRPVSVHDRDDDTDTSPPRTTPPMMLTDVVQIPPASNSVFGCFGQVTAAPGVTLATAAERSFREAEDSGGGGGGSQAEPIDDRRVVTAGAAPETETPPRVSLMRLLLESDDADGAGNAVAEGGEVGCDSMCCVCMGRRKGAAFIPCGHTFCRACARELWLSRKACPLCNHLILEILDIY